MNTIIPTSQWYEKIKGKVDEELLLLQDSNGVFLLDKVDERNIKYITTSCINKPWANHVLLGMLVMSDLNSDPISISLTLQTLNPRLTDLFKSYNLIVMSDFNVEVHLYKYLKGENFTEHSDNMRRVFLKEYINIASKTQKWLAKKMGTVVDLCQDSRHRLFSYATTPGYIRS